MADRRQATASEDAKPGTTELRILVAYVETLGQPLSAANVNSVVMVMGAMYVGCESPLGHTYVV